MTLDMCVCVCVLRSTDGPWQGARPAGRRQPAHGWIHVLREREKVCVCVCVTSRAHAPLEACCRRGGDWCDAASPVPPFVFSRLYRGALLGAVPALHMVCAQSACEGVGCDPWASEAMMAVSMCGRICSEHAQLSHEQ